MRIGLICNEVCVGSLTSLRYMLSYVGRREKLLLEYVFIQNLKSSYFGPCWWKPHVWKVWDSPHLWLPLLFTNMVQWMFCRLTKILFAIVILNVPYFLIENIVDSNVPMSICIWCYLWWILISLLSFRLNCEKHLTFFLLFFVLWLRASTFS